MVINFLIREDLRKICEVMAEGTEALLKKKHKKTKKESKNHQQKKQN
jgi:hypothetical protein